MFIHGSGPGGKTVTPSDLVRVCVWGGHVSGNPETVRCLLGGGTRETPDNRMRDSKCSSMMFNHLNGFQAGTRCLFVLPLEGRITHIWIWDGAGLSSTNPGGGQGRGCRSQAVSPGSQALSPQRSLHHSHLPLTAKTQGWLRASQFCSDESGVLVGVNRGQREDEFSKMKTSALIDTPRRYSCLCKKAFCLVNRN